MALNSAKAQQVWDAALKDLIESGGGTMNEKLQKMELTLRVLPDRKLQEAYREQLAALKKIHAQSEETEGLMESLERSRKDLERKMTDLSFAAGGSRLGKRLMAGHLREKLEEEKRRKAELLEDKGVLAKKIAAQLAEVYARDPKDTQLTALRRDLEAAFKHIRKGDVEQYKVLSSRFDDLESVYGVNGRLAGHLQEVGEEAEKQARRSKERMDQMLEGVKEAASNMAEGIIRSLDRKFGDIGIGPLNLRNAAKTLGLMVKLGGFAIGGVAKTSSLLYRGARSAASSVVGIASSTLRSVYAPEDGTLLRRGYDAVRDRLHPRDPEGPKSTATQSKLSTDKDASKKVEEFHWLKRQVYALEALVDTKKSKGKSGGLLSNLGDLASNFIRSFLGKKALSSLFKKGILGLLGGGAIATVLGKLGLVGLAGFAGYKLGEFIYEKFGTEIVDGIEFVMGYVDKAIGMVTDAMEFVSDFVKDPMGMLKKMGQRISELWEKSSIKKIVDNPLAALKSAADRLLPSKEQVTKFADEAKATGATAVKTVQDSASKAASYTADKASAGWSRLKTWAGKLFNVRSGVDFDGVQPGVKDNFTKMVEEYRNLGGTKPVNVNSGFRSLTHQASLHAKDPKRAAPPGKSAHNYGMAIDADSPALNEMESMGLLSKWGFDRPVKGEPWHLQPANTKTKLGSLGLLSADNPQNQRSIPIDFPQKPRDSAPQAVPNAAPKLVQPQQSSSSRTGMSVANTQPLAYSDNGLFLFNLGVLR